MIRVLHVVGSMNRGGIETFIMNIYRNIDREKVQFDFAIHTKNKCAYDDEIKELGGRIFYITPRGKNIIQHYRDWNNLFRNHPELQIIHQHVSSLTYINPLKIAFRNNVKVRIIHSHSIKAEGKLHHLLHILHSSCIDKYANIYFTCSELAADWLFGKSKVKRKDVHTIKNAIDVEKFIYDLEKRTKIRKKLSIEEDFVIGHVGRFTEAKNHKFLIDVFGEIVNKLEKSKLLLIGRGALEQEIRDYVKEKHLNNKIMFLDGSSNVADIMQAMDAFVFPSLYEGLGMVLIEAQASSLKCFTSEDVVPTEVNLLNLLEYISLKEDKEFWAQKIIEGSGKDARMNTKNIIEDAGFEIKNVATDLQKQYLYYAENMD